MKTERLHVRIEPTLKLSVSLAALKLGMNVSEFVTRSLYLASHNVLTSR